jgi:DNA-directed RNA polymerase subunit RPC12/RpoP
MNGSIFIRCPACGGNLYVEKNLEQIFCMYCGTKLLLKIVSGGLITPQIASDLTPSPKLRETKTPFLETNPLNSQIKELEERVNDIRRSFFEYYHQVEWGFLKKVRILIEEFQVRQGLPANNLRNVWQKYNSSNGKLDLDGMMAADVRGFSTPEDFLKLHQFITQPAHFDKSAYQLAVLLNPIDRIVPDLQKKRKELQKVMDDKRGTGSNI